MACVCRALTGLGWRFWCWTGQGSCSGGAGGGAGTWAAQHLSRLQSGVLGASGPALVAHPQRKLDAAQYGRRTSPRGPPTAGAGSRPGSGDTGLTRAWCLQKAGRARTPHAPRPRPTARRGCPAPGRSAGPGRRAALPAPRWPGCSSHPRSARLPRGRCPALAAEGGSAVLIPPLAARCQAAGGGGTGAAGRRPPWRPLPARSGYSRRVRRARCRRTGRARTAAAARSRRRPASG